MERCNDSNNQRPNSAKKVAFGLIIIVLGALLLADNLGRLNWQVKEVVFSFPMLIIAIGILNLFSRRNYFTGVVIILVGVFFLIPEIFTFTFNFTHLLWPVLLIAIGILIIVRRGVGHHHHFHHQMHDQLVNDNPDGYVDEVNIFGGSKVRIVSQNFKGGRITSIFGGSEIDFTHAQLAEGTNVLDMVCIFGGTSLILPSEWHVRSEVVSILGGFADKRLSNSNPIVRDRELVIKGIAIFGGGEIKSI